MAPVTCDLLIVGGGINGTAIAREAALNGWRVVLVERGDLAGETSSRSSGLIHGGLRYLEQYDFRLVAEALAERERTVRAAPLLVRPIRFIIPHVHAVRPWWLVRLGLVLYDLIGGKRTLARSRSLKKTDAVYLAPLKGAPAGFVYSDAQVDDARLVVLNAMDAAEAGAEIRTRTALEAATREGDGWRAQLSDGTEVHARGLVNAAGPWVAETLGLAGLTSRQQVRLVKGSHMVVPKLYEGDHAYLLQNEDRRIVFVLPWEGMTAIGTTDVPIDRAEDAAIDRQEIAYLCEVVSAHFTKPVTPPDVVGSWSGVRPLHDDGAGAAQTVSRDYLLELDGTALTVFGGKITTARHLAEEAVAKLAPALHLPFHPATRARVLPGGAIADFAAYEARTLAAWPFLGKDRARRMVRAYGSLLPELLEGITDEAGLGRAFGAGLTEAEARWMHTREWARSVEDVLERRSKLGRRMTTEERAEFAEWWAKTFP